MLGNVFLKLPVTAPCMSGLEFPLPLEDPCKPTPYPVLGSPRASERGMHVPGCYTHGVGLRALAGRAFHHGHSAAPPPQPFLAASASLGCLPWSSLPSTEGTDGTEHGLQVTPAQLCRRNLSATPGPAEPHPASEHKPQVVGRGQGSGTQHGFCLGKRHRWGVEQGPQGQASSGHWSSFCFSLRKLSETTPCSSKSTSSVVGQSSRESPAGESGLLMALPEWAVRCILGLWEESSWLYPIQGSLRSLQS